MSAKKNPSKDRNEQRRARTLAAEQDITYQEALQVLRRKPDSQPHDEALRARMDELVLHATTPVLTPDGPRPLGEIKIGDRVLDRDGQPIPVQGLAQLRHLLADICEVAAPAEVPTPQAGITAVVHELCSIADKLRELGEKDPQVASRFSRKWRRELATTNDDDSQDTAVDEMAQELDELLGASPEERSAYVNGGLGSLVASDVRMKAFAVHYAEARTKAQKEALAKRYGISLTACYNTGVRAVRRFLGNDAYAELAGLGDGDAEPI
jgi:hypothetical protein